jgi:hypothetical protein
MRQAGSCLLLVLMAVIGARPAAVQLEDRETVADRIRALTREARWSPVASVPVAFRTFHPQGMTRVGDSLFVSSVEVTVRTRRFDTPIGGHDRDTGEGVGHLFRMDLSGQLLAHVRLGEGTMYHPGGIDFDGTHIWVPVAEYRPDSRSIVYRVDPVTMKVVEMFRFPDHIGAIVRNTDDDTLHGASWGARHFYRWTLGAGATVTDADAAPEMLVRPNPSHYVDYQDCAYMGQHRMACTGVADLRRGPGAPGLRLGGLDLVDLRDGRPLHQVPVPLWTAGGLPMTQNPVWLEPHGSGLRAYFMPEDDQSTLYIYDVAP